LAEVWENAEKNMDLIVDQVQEVKTVTGADKDQGSAGTKINTHEAKEGVSVPETVQFATQGVPISSSHLR
jgi:hypothetical protein